MEDLLLTVPEQSPLWVVFKERHKIRCGYSKERDIVIASDGTYTEEGETEREAVIALVHALQLPGWQTLSLG